MMNKWRVTGYGEACIPFIIPVIKPAFGIMASKEDMHKSIIGVLKSEENNDTMK